MGELDFSGEHYKSLDDKGRFIVPSEFREILVRSGEQEGLVVTKNMDGGLTAFPHSEWSDFRGRIIAKATGKTRTALNRLYIAPKTEVGFDRQGRISLSKALRKHAGLGEDDREVVVVGNFRRIDIFSIDRYEEVTTSDVTLIQGNEALVEELDLP